MTKKGYIFHFLLFLLVFVGSYFLQLNIYKAKFYDLAPILIKTFLINFSVYFFIVAIYFALKKIIKDKSHILYYITIIIKLILVLAVFIPWFKSDGKIEKPEFFSFFIPYAICLVFTVLFLSGTLKTNNK